MITDAPSTSTTMSGYQPPPRPVWFVGKDGEFTCGPPGDVGVHRIKDPLILGSGLLRCRHQGTEGTGQCNRIVLIIGGKFATIRGQTLVLVTRVTPRELVEMKRLKLEEWPDVAKFLGLAA